MRVCGLCVRTHALTCKFLERRFLVVLGTGEGEEEDEFEILCGAVGRGGVSKGVGREEDWRERRGEGGGEWKDDGVTDVVLGGM